jgi:hypothetical protein
MEYASLSGDYFPVKDEARRPQSWPLALEKNHVLVLNCFALKGMDVRVGQDVDCLYF